MISTPTRTSARSGLPYHAYSASGDVTRAGRLRRKRQCRPTTTGSTAQGIDVRGKIALVRYSVPYSYRGFKALTAQQRGAAGILIYSDPADDGCREGQGVSGRSVGTGEPHPARRHRLRLPRAGRSADAGLGVGARRPRVSRRDAISLPTIVSAPLSFKRCARDPPSARRTRSAAGLARRAAVRLSRRALAHTAVRLRVRTDDRIRPVWTVTGLIRGSEQPDDVVIVGNHRDAWVYGGVDPSSGSAALIELARVLGDLTRQRMAAATIDSLRQLGCGRVRAHVVDRVGRAARGAAAQERGRLPECRQRRVRLPALPVGGAGVEPGARRSRANRARSCLGTHARGDRRGTAARAKAWCA